jgi:S1-C subfamily serine protease
MISTNIAYRIAKIGRPDSTQGTGFVVDRGNHLFLVTAAHVVEGIEAGAELDVALRHWRGKMKVFSKQQYADVCAILIEANNIFAPFECIFSKGDLMIAQDLFLIGFPLGWEQMVDVYGVNELNPFVKRAIFSNLGPGDTFYVDTRVNPGFSGSPVVFYLAGDQRPRVAGIVSAYCTDLDGFSICYDINLANMAIDDILRDVSPK